MIFKSKILSIFCFSFVIPIFSILTFKHICQDRVLWLSPKLWSVIDVLRSARCTILFASHFTGTEVHMEPGSPEHKACPGREKSFTKWQQEGMESEQVLDVSTVTSSAGVYFKLSGHFLKVIYSPQLFSVSLSSCSGVISFYSPTKAKDWSCIHSPPSIISYPSYYDKLSSSWLLTPQKQ